MERIFENFTVAILKLNKLISRIKLSEMEGYGLKAIHVMCCYYLNTHAEGLTASELSSLTLEDKAAISRALKSLKQKGYVRYDENTYGAPVTLTVEGKRLANEIAVKADRAVSAGSAFSSEREREAFYTALQKIADNLEKYYEELKKENV